MLPLLAALVFSGSLQAAPAHPCDQVFSQAAISPSPELALERLGGCLAAPAEPHVHARVAVEMARLSLQNGNYEDVARYLDILSLLLEAEAPADNATRAN